MKNIIIVGAGGFGREVAWLIERINEVEKEFEIMGFCDDGIEKNTLVNGYPVLGTINEVNDQYHNCGIVIAIGKPTKRKEIYEILKEDESKEFPNIMDPSCIVNRKSIGKGNIICAQSIFTVNYEIGNFNLINLSCTIGHDVKTDDFVTVYPGVNISGNTLLEECVEVGTGTKIIQGIKIGHHSILAAGCVVTKDIPRYVMVAGCPGIVKKNFK